MVCRAILALLVLSGGVHAADWPRWLGPNGDGSTPETVKPWQGKLPTLWKQDVGEGNSGPVVAGDRVIVMSLVKGKLEEQLTAYDVKSGKVLWQTAYRRAEMKTPYGNGPRGTPAVAGGKVYSYGITGLLTCFDFDDGKQLWQVDTAAEFKPPKLLFGASCSPLVEKDAVLINVGAKGASIVAFHKDTGKVLWKSQDDGPSYASPIVFGAGADRQVVFLTQQGLLSLRPNDGQPVWRYPFKDLILESSTTPVHVNGSVVASSITLGSVAVAMEEMNQKPAVRLEWKNPTLTCYFATPVAVGKDHVYAVIGANPLAALNPFGKKAPPKASLKCIDVKTGKALWTRPDVGTYHATLLRTGDEKLLMLEEPGDLVLIDPNAKAYRELARAKVCGNTWAHPAIANGHIFVRDGGTLRCLKLDP
ncbi:MAG: hypothetical protein FJ271_28785 [Planctomycetes bacterium]|nr:hypothetical protein [Planctomycetota bacterium]